MRSYLRKAACLLLAAVLFLGSAAAISQDQIKTKFDYLLWQIENTSLYTQQDGMSQVAIDYWNTYLKKNPNQLSKAVNEYLSTLDTHSMFLTEKDYGDSFSTIVGYAGVGVTVQQTEDGLSVTNVNRSGPAQEVGVQAGDLIAAVNGKKVEGMTTTELAALLRGDAGTSLTLRVLRAGKTIDFTITRRHIQQEYVSAQTAESGVEYVRVESMGSQNDLARFKEVWAGLEAKDTRAVILDLRGNGGGLIDVAWGMANTILEKKGTYMGGVLWREDQGGFEKHYAVGGGYPLQKLCVLVDRNTASAAELLAGVLKEAGGAELIGETTYGKGQGQYHMTVLDGKSYLVVTALEMHLPKAGCWEGVGIAPTMQVAAATTASSYLKKLPALDAAGRIVYGEKSDQVRALSGRLFLLGYAPEATQVFDTELLTALRGFQKKNNLPQRVVAEKDTIAALNLAIEKLGGEQQVLDNVYLTALGLCRQAAAGGMLPAGVQAVDLPRAA